MKINYRDAYESSRIFIDMLKKENEHLNLQLDQALKDYDELQEENEKLKQSLESRLKYSDELDKKIEAIDKAIESIKIMKEKNDMYGTKLLAIDINHLETLLNILQGDDNNAKD